MSLSPLFDGSPTSLGSDGEYIPHGSFKGAGEYAVRLPAGSGGGCVHTGPFSDMVVHVGPVTLPVYGGAPGEVVGSPNNALVDVPRCLKRDLRQSVAAKWASYRNSTELILNNPTIRQFQEWSQGDPRSATDETRGMGVHGGGHYTFGGDPGADPYTSCGDPVFYLHHAQIDRLYWIWQSLDWPNRQGIYGTGTWLNNPPTPEVNIDEFIDLRPLNEPRRIRDLIDAVGGTPSCHVYSPY